MSLFNLLFGAPPGLTRRSFLCLLTGAAILLLEPSAMASGSDSGSGGSGSDDGGGDGGGNDGPGHDDDDDDDDDSDEATKEVTAGNAVPLVKIIAEVQKKVPGEVLDAKFHRRFGRLTYVLTVLSTSGTYFTVTVNARTKAILNVQEK